MKFELDPRVIMGYPPPVPHPTGCDTSPVQTHALGYCAQLTDKGYTFGGQGALDAAMQPFKELQAANARVAELEALVAHLRDELDQIRRTLG
jgi:hypothetical protein